MSLCLNSQLFVLCQLSLLAGVGGGAQPSSRPQKVQPAAHRVLGHCLSSAHSANSRCLLASEVSAVRWLWTHAFTGSVGGCQRGGPRDKEWRMLMTLGRHAGAAGGGEQVSGLHSLLFSQPGLELGVRCQ